MQNRSLSIILILVFFVVLTFFYCLINLSNIYSWKANQEFKKGNVEKSQYFYEKAFDKGLHDSKHKNIYLNTIINSPFNIKAQEKLINFVKNLEENSVKEKALYFLTDFKNEINNKYNGNFISQTVYNQKIIHWGSLPITYGFEKAENIPDYFVEEIKNAFTEWEKVTEHQILFEYAENNPNILIKFNYDVTQKKDGNSKYIVAYTSPIIETGMLKRMEILFYLTEPNGDYYSRNQLYNTALHEIVHALGFMGHSNNRQDIMYLTKDSFSVDNDLREIPTESDINTVKLLYKIKPDITNVDEGSWDYLPSIILGDEEEVNNAKIREAKTYIRKAPEISAGYMDLAEAYVSSKEYSKAIKSLERALVYADTDEIKSLIYYNLAVTYYLIDLNELALKYLEDSMKIQDTDEKRYLLADLYAKENKIKESVIEYEKLIEKNPKNVEYTIALTNLYVVNKKLIDARKTLKNYVKNNPEDKNNPRFDSYGILKIGL